VTTSIPTQYQKDGFSGNQVFSDDWLVFFFFLFWAIQNGVVDSFTVALGQKLRTISSL
jgi:hypothetical protein